MLFWRVSRPLVVPRGVGPTAWSAVVQPPPPVDVSVDQSTGCRIRRAQRAGNATAVVSAAAARAANTPARHFSP